MIGSSGLTQVVLPLCLFIVMLGMGLSLTINEFKRVLVHPKAICIGLLGQFILLPLCGFIIAVCLVDEPVLAVGLMLLAACPGGTVSNIVAHLARGDLALSISLTAVSSLITFITIPLIVGFSLTYFESGTALLELPLVQTMGALFGITLVPVSIGMLVKYVNPTFALQVEPIINRFAILFLLFLMIMVTFQNRSLIVDSFMSIGLATLLLNTVAMSFGLLLARQFKLDSKQVTSIGLEVGIQNSALAMLVATSVLQNSAMAISPAVYSLVMFVTSGVVIAARTIPLSLKSVEELD